MSANTADYERLAEQLRQFARWEFAHPRAPEHTAGRRVEEHVAWKAAEAIDVLTLAMHFAGAGSRRQ